MMTTLDIICIWIAELVPLLCSVMAFIYGVLHFFKKGKALYLQIVTVAMGCFALSCLYQVCQHFVLDRIADGFTATYLGLVGFYLFLFTANFGQMNGILDDGTAEMRPARYIGLLGPLLAAVLYIPCALSQTSLSVRVANMVVWITAATSMYYNMKHAVIPDLGYGFAKAVRPYNVSAFTVSALELLTLIAWCYYGVEYIPLIVALLSVVTGIMLLVTMHNLEKGVKKWTI